MTEIFDAKDVPLLTRQEQYFKKYFAEGGLVRVSGDTFRLGVWNESEDVTIEDSETKEKKPAKGYVLECEIIMTRKTAVKLRDLLTYKLNEGEGTHQHEDELHKE